MTQVGGWLTVYPTYGLIMPLEKMQVAYTPTPPIRNAVAYLPMPPTCSAICLRHR